ncbi:MAG: calcium-binding protein [Solirubrobacterales bacterium]
MRRLLLTIPLALAAAALLPAAASAAPPTCAFTNDAAPNDVVVMLGTDPDSAKLTLQVSSGTIQILNANGAAVVCAPDTPTVSNTTSITVNDAAAHNTALVVNEQNGTFAPGLNTPPDAGVPEIDITLAMLDGTDSLQVDGTDNADNFLFGQSAAGNLGANLNNTETTAADATDLVASGVEAVTINGRKGDDTISLVGNAGIAQIAAPLVRGPLLIDGGNQNDTLRGGAGNEDVHGGTQDDDLDGGGATDSMLGEDGDDSLKENAGPDLMDGGTGTDLATYATRTNAVNVTADGVPNDGGAEDSFGDNVTATVENINGGAEADTLGGNALVNSITGNAGNDTASGGDGNDKVSGSDGVDRLLGQVGNDKIFGGLGNDNLVGGGNNDKLTGNAGKDIFFGKNGIDRLIAKDNTKDKKLSCGKGSNKRESFTKDRKDPKPKSC